MKRSRIVIVLVAFLIMGGGCFALVHLRATQKLGNPGLRFEPIAGKQNVKLLLPLTVGPYFSEVIPTTEEVYNTLPKDTSLMQRLYRNGDGFGVALNAVLMGTDRTSIHKPQFCLPGHGWKIVSEEMGIPLELKTSPSSKMLVSKITINKDDVINGQTRTLSGVYLYWFVAENSLACGHWERIWLMSKHLLTTGKLDRWAYISSFSVCHKGEEEQTQKRMFDFLSEAIPKFQTTLPGSESGVAKKPELKGSL
ncbi:MAG: eight transrane protein EpsH [Verrucomicrobiales bacterium]|nr:eight transrane protein EpsH [Verrucomicrobiales bacterium]